MNFNKLIATGLGTGYSPVAPGTMGAITGISGMYFLNFSLDRFEFGKWNILAFDLFVIGIVTVIGIKAIKNVHEIWEHDSNKIVIDEVVGVSIAALLIPLKIEYYFLAFILFRLFDIFKPFYIKQIDKLKGNWPVMLDDILAGIYALIITQTTIFFLNH